MVEQEIIKLLEEERDHIEQEISKLEEEKTTGSERREGSPFGKREEEADGAMELEKRLAMEKHLTDTLTDINKALNKARAGNYGTCDICGQAIEPGRLEAIPYANMCIKCKSKQEKDLRGRSTH